jgi:hypothetical protein
MSNGNSGRSSHIEGDDEGGDRVYQRNRSRPLLGTAGILSMFLGLGGVLFSLALLYTPESANPIEVSADPVLGLTGIAGAGILLILLGFLGYYFSRKAGL